MNAHFIRRESCPACASPGFETLRTLPYADPVMRGYLDRFYEGVGRVDHAALAGAEYAAAACRTCGAFFQRDIPDHTLLEQLYEHWIDPVKVFECYERRQPLMHYVFLARQVEMAIRFLEQPPGALKLLDLGMGWGDWCRFGNAFGCETYGLEISASRIACARERGIRVLDYTELETHTFDMINAEQVFEHLPDPLETLRALRPRLKSGGLLWMAVPNGADLRRRIAQWDWTVPKDHPDSLNALAPLEHLNGFTHDALVHMAALAGLKPVAVPRPRPAKAAPPPPESGRQRWLPFGRRRAVSAAATPLPTGTELYFTPA